MPDKKGGGKLPNNIECPVCGAEIEPEGNRYKCYNCRKVDVEITLAEGDYYPEGKQYSKTD